MTLVDEIVVKRLGTAEYLPTLEAMRQFTAARDAATADELWILQHPPVYTLGQAATHAPVANGIPLVKADRGGDITYHGPGQVVGYPILKLSQHGGDLLRYLRMLEETLIVALASYGVGAGRIAGLTGVWVGDAKIAAIGVKLSASGVTHHGFALNVATNMRYFQQIIPCGIADKGVTSLELLLGSAPPHAEVEQRVAAAFGAVFGVHSD